MYLTINTASSFRDEFHHCGRSDQFSYEALGLLFDFFEDVSPNMELDVIAICCDYSEDMPEDIAQNYSIDIEGLNEGEVKEAVEDYLNENTSLVGETSSGAFVYANF